jgi:hypothetical protein
MADARIANLRESFPQRLRTALIRAVVEGAQKERRSLSPHDKLRFGLVATRMHHDLYFDRHRDLCKLMGVEPVVNKDSHSKDWRGASEKMFVGNPVAMMIAMTLMHRYHVGGYSGGNPDPLKPLLGAYKIDRKAIAKKIKGEADTKIAEVQAALKRHKASARAQVRLTS